MQRGIIMKNNNLLEKIQADMDFEKNAAAEVRAEIDREMKKPARKRNYDRIAALSAEYNELIGAQEDTPQQKQEAIEKILSLTTQCQETTQKSKANIRLHRRIVAAAASVIVLLGANTVSLKVSGENIFSSVYHLSKNGITWRSYELPEDNEPFVPDNDPYDIGKRIYEWEQWDNLAVLIPTYIPKGFEESEFKADNNEISFNYINGKNEDFFENAYISFALIRTPKESSFGVPCDEYNIQEIRIDNFYGTVFEEDMQMNAVFDISEYVSSNTSNYYIYLSTMNVPYTEARKILSTMKQYKE